jgi:hypothetical protein
MPKSAKYFLALDTLEVNEQHFVFNKAGRVYSVHCDVTDLTGAVTAQVAARLLSAHNRQPETYDYLTQFAEPEPELQSNLRINF